MNEFDVLIRFGLLLVRPSMVVMAAPPFGAAYAPAPVRLGLTLLLTLMLAVTVPTPTNVELVGLAVVVARELAIGLAIALAIRALLAGAEFAGSLSGYQLGFSYGSIIDPASGVRNGTLPMLYGNLALVAFFMTNGHHALIRALASSYQQLPIGTGGVDGSLVGAVTGMLGLVFVLGVRLAMPLILVLLVVELAMGLIARAAPAINLMVISQPVRIVIGLLVVASVLSLAPGLIARFSERALELGMRGALAFR